MHYKMSYFNGSIWQKEPTDQPVSVEQVYRMIVSDEGLRNSTRQLRKTGDFEKRKKMLPYVTPNGIFTLRENQCLQQLSGLISIDIDKLDSLEEAERIRDKVFQDPMLQTVLSYVSPGGRGVKCFIPYEVNEAMMERIEQLPTAEERNAQLALVVREAVQMAMEYVDAAHAPEHVDKACHDLARACFLCHDAGAKFRREG